MILNFYFLLSGFVDIYHKVIEVVASQGHRRSMLIEALFTNAVGTLIVYFVGLFAQK